MQRMGSVVSHRLCLPLDFTTKASSTYLPAYYLDDNIPYLSPRPAVSLSSPTHSHSSTPILGLLHVLDPYHPITTNKVPQERQSYHYVILSSHFSHWQCIDYGLHQGSFTFKASIHHMLCSFVFMRCDDLRPLFAAM